MDNINLTRQWNYAVNVYNLDGTIVNELCRDQKELIVAEPEKVGDNVNIIALQTANGGTWTPGSLDNKIIRIIVTSDKAKVIDGFEGVAQTEPLLAFSNLHADFKRPEIAFSAVPTSLYEAGAGRNTLCAPDALTTTVEFWHSLGLKELKNAKNDRAKIYENYGLAPAENYFEKEEPAFYELSVAYPFVLKGIVRSDNNGEVLSSDGLAGILGVDDFSSEIGIVETKYNSKENIALYGADADSVVTYRIPKEYFIPLDQGTQKNNKYSLRFVYGFAPNEVAKFDGQYITGTVSARNSDTKSVSLKGSSIPTYNEKADFTFKQYREVTSTPITFTNLPSFEYRLDQDGAPVEVSNYKGGFYLRNTTKADWDATQRYDDDIVQLGWKVIYNYEEDEEVKQDTVFVQTWGNGYEQLPSVVPNKNTRAYNYSEVNFKLNDCSYRTGLGFEIEGSQVSVFKNGAGALNIIDCTGKYGKDIVSVEAVFRCERKDVNISDDESLNPAEIFQLAGEQAWATYANKDAYKYSGADLIAKKDGASYNGPIELHAANAFVWYSFENDEDMLSSVVHLDINDKFGTYSGCFDMFYSPYKIGSMDTQRQYKSRTHTVRIYAIGENLEKDANGNAIIKVFKEKFTGGVNDLDSADDSFQQTNNGFWFSSDYKDENVNISWKKDFSTSAAGIYMGRNVTDTLYIKVNLSTPTMNARLKNEGIPVQVVYQPQNDLALGQAALDVFKYWMNNDRSMNGITIDEISNIVDHVAQFGILTENGHNEFYTFGITDAGLVTTMNVDTKIGSYSNLAEFVNNTFGPECAIHGTYKDLYTKDHGTYYVGQDCLNDPNGGVFYIAGLNLRDKVVIDIAETADDAFARSVVAAEGYGTIDTLSTTRYELNPNEYGELLVYVNTTFEPVAADKALATDEVKVVNGDHRQFHYLTDSIYLVPVQTEGHDKVYFYDLNKKNKWSSEGGSPALSIFGLYGAYATDTLSTVIKGDVKVPEIWLSHNVEGTDTIKANDIFDFKTVIAGETADSCVYLQGRDLPMEPNKTVNSEELVNAELQVITDNNITAGAEKIDIKNEAVKYATANNLEYLADIAARIDLTAEPDCDDLCTTKSVLSIEGLCGMKQEAEIILSGIEIWFRRNSKQDQWWCS